MRARVTRFAVAATVFTALAAFAGPSQAAESVQKQCGDEWAAAKKAGKVAPGQAWPGFLSECRKRHAGDTTAPAAPAKAEKAADKKAEKAAEKKAEKAEKAAEKKADKAAEKKADKAAPAGASADINETCKAEYAAGKASGAVVKGTNYFKFLSECKKRHAGDAAPPAKSAATAPEPAKPAPPKTTTADPAKPPATTPGKPASGGREAMYERERTCGAKWKTIKGTAALPAGITTWPKYWSYCNARLKAGQAI